jgi:hypothetical protein
MKRRRFIGTVTAGTIAGNALATYDFRRKRRMYYNAADLEESAHTIKKIASLADIVVPGQ